MISLVISPYRRLSPFAVIREVSVRLSAEIRVKTFPDVASILCLAVLIFAPQQLASAQSGALPQATPTQIGTSGAAKHFSAPVVSQKPTIDGKLDDAVWKSVAPITGLVQREHNEGEPVSERTEVRI